MGESDELRDEALSALGKVAKDLYEDGLQPTLRPLGTTLGRTVNAALSPLRGLVWSFERTEAWVSRRVERLLAEAPAVVTPDPRVAVPTLLQLSYSMESETIRELYAQLLATAMDASRAHLAHPAFVEIIQQINPDEALILPRIAAWESLPIVRVERADASALARHTGYRPTLLTWDSIYDGCSRPDLAAVYLDNLHRLRLVEVDMTTSATGSSEEYRELEERAEVIKKAYEAEGDMVRGRITDGRCVVTSFGRGFIAACGIAVKR